MDGYGVAVGLLVSWWFASPFCFIFTNVNVVDESFPGRFLDFFLLILNSFLMFLLQP